MRKWLLLLAGLATLVMPVSARGQATVVQAPVPKFRSFQASGAPNSSGCVYTFASGTSTPQATYTDATGSTTNSNPVQLDGNGEAQIFITSATYRFQVWTFGSGALGSNCGNGTQLYQIDGIRDTGLNASIASLAAVVTINTATNAPTITTVNPSGAGHNYNIPDPGTGGNFVVNPSGNSGTSNTLDCTLSGITCKRTAQYFFRGGQCNGTTAGNGFDSFTSFITPLCVTGSNIQKGASGFPSAYNHTQQNTGTNSATTTITTTYPAALLGGNGDLLVLSVAFNATTTISGCTDGTNAYTQAKHIGNGALSLDIWYFANPTTKAAGTTLTCTFSAAATGAIRWHEYIAAANSISLDVTASSTGTGNSIATGTTVSTAQATELVFAAGANISNDAINSPGTGYVDHGQVASNNISVVDDAGIIAQVIGGQSTSFGTAGSPAWAGAIATFKATTGSNPVAQQSIALPAFYNSAQNVNALVKWSVSAVPISTSNAVLAAAVVCVADGATDDSAFNADTTATVTIPTSAVNINSTATLSALAQGSCAAGQTMHFQVKRLRYNSSDTYEGFIQVVGASLQIGITQ